MITENDLLEAIAECQGERNPNANTCIKLAAYYTILDNIRTPERVEYPQIQTYSTYTPNDTIEYNGDSDFAQKINGKPIAEVMAKIDDLMSTLQVINPRLYESAMREL